MAHPETGNARVNTTATGEGASCRPVGTAILAAWSSSLRSSCIVRAALLLVVSSALAHPAFAQDADSTRSGTEVAGSVSITTKGISTIPSLTLGRPAAIFDVAIRRGDLSFEPQFRFGLDGKPWSFLFWWRYRLLEGEKLQVNVGAHPAISFRVMPVSTEGVPRNVIAARRSLAGELNPSYAVSSHLRVGMYYLYSYGVEEDVTKNTHFLSLRASLTSAGLSDQYIVRLAPQLYYLRMDDRDGLYLNSGLTLAKRGFPLPVSAMVNKVVQTRILAGEDFLWNVSVNYSIR